jgi:hypothetical protein
MAGRRCGHCVIHEHAPTIEPSFRQRDGPLTLNAEHVVVGGRYSRRWKQNHSHTIGRPRQIVVLGGKRDAAAHGEARQADRYSLGPIH